MTSLLPCPFCGSAAEVISEAETVCVVCKEHTCFCALGENSDSYGDPDHYFYTVASATAAWNTRQPPPAPAPDQFRARLLAADALLGTAIVRLKTHAHMARGREVTEATLRLLPSVAQCDMLVTDLAAALAVLRQLREEALRED